LLSKISYHHPVIKFGCKTTNQIQARKITVANGCTNFVLKIYKNKYSLSIEGVHAGMVYHVMGAVAVAYQLGIQTDTMIAALRKPVVVPGRFEKRILTQGKGTLINDCYNANPESIKAALLAFDQLPTKAKKIVVLGDMLELGTDTAFWHRQIGRFMRKISNVSHLILVGSAVQWTHRTVPRGLLTEHVSAWQEALEKVKQQTAKQEVCILVKGSHGMHLVHLVDALT
jgi:UDP-N-acetylmuramoyl-tripeptide--D-alanyl-D-alanine ligase